MNREIQPEEFSPSVTDGRERCAIYTRYSSDNQRQSSTEDQQRNCREAAADRGWVVIEKWVVADEEKTGTTLVGRTGLNKLVEAAKAKDRPFDRIVIDHTDRLGRNTADSIKTVDILMHHGVSLFFVNRDLDSSNPLFRDLFIGLAYADEQYSRSHGQRVKRGRRGRFLKGMNPGEVVMATRMCPWKISAGRENMADPL